MVLTIDGVRWQEVFGGVDRRLAREHGLKAADAVGPEKLVPALHDLAFGEGAVLGAPHHGATFSASDRAVKSLPAYMEIASGRTTTGCDDNACGRIRRATLFDQLAARPGVALGEVAVLSSWSGIARAVAAHPSRMVISAGRVTGEHLDLLRTDKRGRKILSRGTRAEPGPGFGDYRPDRYTAELALRYLRVRRPRLLFIGLGDPDEWGHRNDYRRYLDALRFADHVVEQLVRSLASLRRRGWKTALLVTTDHGRDAECRDHGHVAAAKRSWLVAAGSLIRAHGPVRSPVSRHLADIAPTLRRLLGLEPDVDPHAGRPLEELLSHRPGRNVASVERSAGDEVADVFTRDRSPSLQE